MNYRKIGLDALIGSTLIGWIAFAGCSKLEPINGPAFQSGNADFSAYAAIGTSISAGSQSGGGLVVYHQRRSFPADFAGQVRATFTIPSFSPDGFPALLRLVSLSPLVISSAGRTDGVPTNLTQATAYHNMAVPGAILLDVADSSLYYNAGVRGPVQVQRFNYIVRHRGTILTEVASLQPTFVSFEMGSNEVLGPVVNAGSGTALVPSVQFAALLHGTLDGLHAVAPNAKLALVNVPDVTSIPFCTTIKPWVVFGGQLVPLIGPSGPLDPHDLVLLTAVAPLSAGVGIPVALGGTGQPLPDAVVLRVSEATELQATTAAYNAAIAAEASARGAALVDLNGLLRRAATTGIKYQGTLYTSAFITGGLFSLDAIHPNDFAYGLLCNVMIDAVNAKFGSSIPEVNLSSVASLTASSMRPSGGLPVIRNAPEVYRDIVPWRAPLP